MTQKNQEWYETIDHCFSSLLNKDTNAPGLSNGRLF